jgi:hypothetical protein
VEVTIAHRFRGPLTSANGGSACGVLAGFLDSEAVEVTLRLPPPLGRSLDVRIDDGHAFLLDSEAVVAEARPAPLDIDLPAGVSLAEAAEAATHHVRLGNTVFAECFVCGVREDGDGLGIYAGSVAGREPLLAAPWTVGESAPEIVWAAIDCPGAYAVGAAGRGEVVLGRMTAGLARVPEAGERCVVIAWPLGEAGRKLFAGAALFGEDGELLARARQVWIRPRSTSGG